MMQISVDLPHRFVNCYTFPGIAEGKGFLIEALFKNRFNVWAEKAVCIEDCSNQTLVGFQVGCKSLQSRRLFLGFGKLML